MSYIIICLHHMKSSPHHSILINTQDLTSGHTTVSLLWVFLGFSPNRAGSIRIVSCVFNLNGVICERFLCWLQLLPVWVLRSQPEPFWEWFNISYCSYNSRIWAAEGPTLTVHIQLSEGHIANHFCVFYPNTLSKYFSIFRKTHLKIRQQVDTNTELF